MLNNLSIKARLVAVLAILSVVMTVVGMAGITSLSGTNDSLKTVYEDRLLALGNLQEVIRYINRNQIAMGGVDNVDPAKLPETVASVEANIAAASKAWQRFAETQLTAEEKQLAERFAAQRQVFLSEGLKPALAAARSGDTAAVNALLKGRMEQAFLPMRDSMDKLIQLQKDVGKQEFDASQRNYGTFRLLTAGLLVAGLGLAAGIGWWLVRSITVPLNRAVQVAQAVAGGDLTQQIEVRSKDETGQLLAALRDMNSSLAGIVGEVRHATDSITTASSEIANGNMDLSSRTEQQAGSLEETASSMEELTSTVRQNADNARHANQLASSASQVAQRGGAVVSQVVDKMGAINESAYKIVEIITVIDGIAFQTNILALNAAVEAARAGEQGRGFAVVASEVRNLAQRSASAAKEIKQLIDNSVAQVEEGSRLADNAGSTMQEVVASVQRMTDIIGAISTASDEQSAGIQQVNEAVVQMDGMTQQNAALVEQAAAAAGALQDQTASLARAVSVFRLAGGAAGAHATPAPGALTAMRRPQNSAVVMQLQPRGRSGAKVAVPA